MVSELGALGPEKTLLDLGTCFGQDLRVYGHHGAPCQSLFGSDLHQEFVDRGFFKPFQDRERLGSNIVARDIFAETDPLGQFKGKINYITATAFIHIFSRKDQVKAREKMIQFLKPFDGESKVKQIIFGKQTATIKPDRRIRDDVPRGQKELSLYEENTCQELWEEVDERTGTRWKVTTELRPWHSDGVKGVEKGEIVRLLVFSLERLG